MFDLDPAFVATSQALGDLALSHARLQDDARYPWIVLIPRVAAARELEDLSRADLATLTDEILAVTDRDAFTMTRRLAVEHGLLVGGSSGMAVAAALRVARDLDEDAVVVVLLPDHGRGYLSKIFDDEWMTARGFAVDAADSPAAPVSATPETEPRNDS